MPLISDVEGILDDYFARRPPFSAKKKAEFPDAISIASVRLWCQQYGWSAYVVSDDPDLRACCSESGPLFHADSIAEIISQATVSQELHQALEKALRESAYLSERLVEEIQEMDVRVEPSSSLRRRVLGARIDDVRSVNVISANVFEQQEQTFTCELEVEAEVSLDIDVEIEGGYSYGGPDDYQPPERHSILQSRTEYLYATVVVRFDSSTEDLEFESISTGTQAIRVGFDDLEGPY